MFKNPRVTSTEQEAIKSVRVVRTFQCVVYFSYLSVAVSVTILFDIKNSNERSEVDVHVYSEFQKWMESVSPTN